MKIGKTEITIDHEAIKRIHDHWPLWFFVFLGMSILSGFVWHEITDPIGVKKLMGMMSIICGAGAFAVLVYGFSRAMDEITDYGKM